MATSTDLRAAIEEVQNQLPEEQSLEGEGLGAAYQADLTTRGAAGRRGPRRVRGRLRHAH